MYFWPKSEMDDSDEPATEKVDGLEDQSCNEDYLRIERSAQSETCHFFTAEEVSVFFMQKFPKTFLLLLIDRSIYFLLRCVFRF